MSNSFKKRMFILLFALMLTVLLQVSCTAPDVGTGSASPDTVSSATPSASATPTQTPTPTPTATHEDTATPPAQSDISPQNEPPESASPETSSAPESVAPPTIDAATEWEPGGQTSNDETLDAEVLKVINEVCSPDNTLEDNLWACFDWMVKNLSYKGIAVDLSAGYTDALVTDLSLYLIQTLRGSCEHQAALFSVFATRLGCESVVVAGDFLSDDGTEWVEHAWVIAAVDGSYRHFDVLFGRNHTGGQPRSMFMQTDQSIVRHRWNTDDYPKCD